MKKFKKSIGHITINIIIDTELFDIEYKAFNAFFSSFIYCGEYIPQKYVIEDKEFFYYILTNNNNNKINNNCFLLNKTNNKWMFELMKKLAKFYSSILECTVLHCSSVRIENKNILFMGARRSGKTTMTHYLTINKNGIYLDDDSIYIEKDRYIGFNMPLPMRMCRVKDLNIDKFFVGQTIDTDGILRTLYMPPKRIDCLCPIDAIVFPKYGRDKLNRIEKISKAEAFKNIINNVSSYAEMKTMFLDVKKLALNSDCYEMEYSSSESAYKLLLDQVLNYESNY